jgi:AraC-like DNA-binding protein
MADGRTYQWVPIENCGGSPHVLGALRRSVALAERFTVPAHILSGCTILLRGRMHVFSAKGDRQPLPAMHVFGAFSRHSHIEVEAHTEWLTVFSRADAWPRYAKVPGSHFANQYVDLQAVAALKEVVDQLRALPSAATSDIYLKLVGVKLASIADSKSALVIDQLLRPLNAASLATCMKQLTYTERAVQRAFASNFGLPVKVVERIMRAGRAAQCWDDAQLAHPAKNLADLALEVGYTDQAHMAKEFKILIGYPPKTLKTKADSEADLLWALRQGMVHLGTGMLGRT